MLHALFFGSVIRERPLPTPGGTPPPMGLDLPLLPYTCVCACACLCVKSAAVTQRDLLQGA